MTFRNNTIKDGSCPGCRGGIHGLELSVPNQAALSSILIENNTIFNNTASGIYKNSGASLNNVTIRNNNVYNNRSNFSGVSGN